MANTRQPSQPPIELKAYERPQGMAVLHFMRGEKPCELDVSAFTQLALVREQPAPGQESASHFLLTGYDPATKQPVSLKDNTGEPLYFATEADFANVMRGSKPQQPTAPQPTQQRAQSPQQGEVPAFGQQVNAMLTGAMNWAKEHPGQAAMAALLLFSLTSRRGGGRPMHYGQGGQAQMEAGLDPQQLLMASMGIPPEQGQLLMSMMNGNNRTA